jgi:uncharacterized protein YjbI with pentapeptide repeats
VNLPRLGRHARLGLAAGIGGAIVLAGVAVATATPSAPSCQPGSGAQLAGKQLTASAISGYNDNLRCANLTGANLAGLSLLQIDFTGAIMRNANLQHANLSQATLNYADLSGANLTDASLLQVFARHAKFVGSNLSGVDFTQADLTQANLSKTNLSGATFDETTLDHTTFTGATGLLPFNLFVNIAAVLFLLLLLWGPVRRSVRKVATQGIGYSNKSGTNASRSLVRGILGSVIVAFGFNLAIGGFLGEVVSAAGPPVSQTCAGTLCTIGVSSGFIGLFGGIVLMIVGFIVRAAKRSQPVTVGTQPVGGSFGGTYDPGSPF